MYEILNCDYTTDVSCNLNDDSLSVSITLPDDLKNNRYVDEIKNKIIKSIENHKSDIVARKCNFIEISLSPYGLMYKWLRCNILINKNS